MGGQGKANLTLLTNLRTGWLAAIVVEDIVYITKSRRFDSRAGKIGFCCQRLATTVTICVAQALSHRDAPSPLASA